MKKLSTILLTIAFLLPSTSQAARLWSSGAELQSVTAAVEYDAIVGSPTINTSTKRSGEASIRINPTAATQHVRYEVAADTTDVKFARVYIYLVSAPASLTQIIKLSDSTVTGDGLGIRLNSNRTLECWDDSVGLQVGSDSSAINLNQWYRIELSNGAESDSVSARIDGVDICSTGSLDGVGAVAPIRLFVGALSSATMDMYIDDIAVNNELGTDQNSFPGAGSIVHLQPNAAGDTDGSTSNPNGWQAVDEVTPDDATTIAVLDANNDVLSVNLESASSAGIDSYDTVTLVQVGERSSAFSAAAMSWRLGIKSQSSGTITYSATTTHNDVTYRTNGDTTAPQIYTVTSYLDPQAGGSWTTTLLDSTQILMLAGDATPDINLSTLWALVEYVDGTASVNYAPIYLGSGKLILTNGKMLIY